MIGIRGLWAAAAISAALLAGAATAAAAGPAGEPDRAATLAYLHARTVFEQANLETLPSAVSAVRAQAARLESECPGVLAGAPQESFLPFAVGQDRLSARARGEATRAQRQLGYMQFELGVGLEAPLQQAEQPHVAAFAAAVLPLRWSDPAISAAVAAQIRSLQSVEAPPQVCSDMRFWAASAFKEVSAATRTFVTTLDARLYAFAPPPEALLAHYGYEKTPTAKTAVHALEQLFERAAAIEQPVRAIRQSLSLALGLRPAERYPPRRRKPAVAVAHGRTAAGERWVARVRRDTGCGIELSVGDPKEQEGNESWCFSNRRDEKAEPSVDCNEGRLTISATTLAHTTLVRLRMSDGHTVSSPPIRVPRRLGGPIGLYYQVVRGPSPIPRLLTELDASGHVLRITHLPRIVECTKHPIKYLPGGRRTLATGAVPGGGPRFSIVTKRYRFLGKVYFNLEVQVQQEPRGFLGGPIGGGSGSGRLVFGRSPRAFAPEDTTGCTPRPYEILYGLLRDPGQTVLAGGPGPSAPLTVVPLPASLHERGVLVYGAFSPPPATLTLRDSAGRTLGTQPLEAQEFVETCEGEAEPGGPLP